MSSFIQFAFYLFIYFCGEPGHFTRTAYMELFLMKLPIVLSSEPCKWKLPIIFASVLLMHLDTNENTVTIGTWGLIISKEACHRILETFLISPYCKIFDTTLYLCYLISPTY